MVKNERVVAFIVARLSSSRLPKKHLKMIGNRRMIDWTIHFTKQFKYLDEIVIATTNEEENQELVNVAKEHDIKVFLYDGDINDVVGRLTKAAIEFDADIPILVSGDCPLICPNATNKRIEKIAKDKELDYVDFCQYNGRFPVHSGIDVFRKKAWILANKMSDKPNLREHQFPVIRIFKDRFKTDCIRDEYIFYKIKHRISVDTLADLEFMNAVFEELQRRNKSFDLRNVIKLLIENPNLMEINKDVHQIEVWEKQRKALFKVQDKNNLTILFKLACELTKMGIGVRFYTENNKVKELIESRGFGVSETLSNDFNFLITDKN